jgi:thioredoxin-like negative regulator of GroEL
MGIGRRVIRALLAALFVITVAGAAQAQIGRVGGIVKSEDGQPLKGATITAENPNIGQHFTATTDDKGRFTMIGLRAGTWRFIAQSPGFSPEGGQMAVRMGTPNPPVAFTLKKTGVANFGALGGISNKDLQDGLEMGDRAFASKRWDEAIQAYRTVLDRSPVLAVVNLQIATAYRNKKDYDAALGAYGELLKSDPDNARAHVGIAETYVEKVDRRGGEDALLKAAQSATARREVLFTLADWKFDGNDTAEAQRWYQKAAEADPFWGKPIYKLGLCAMKSGNTDEAARLMARVIAVDPVSPEAALAKASLETLKK